MDQYWIDRGGQEGGEFGFAMPVRSRTMAQPLSRRDIHKAEFLQIARPCSRTKCGCATRHRPAARET
jgi:hypothetical protein